MVEATMANTDPADDMVIREASIDDVGAIIRLDELNTGLAKADYWRDMFERYGAREDRFFLVSEIEDAVRGFIIGEVRAWEFGSPPCGWIFALGVDPERRLQGNRYQIV